MCYKAPGPRCTAHARKRLEKAQEAYTAEETLENWAEVQQAQAEYDTTPGGQRALRNAIQNATGAAKTQLEDRLERGVAVRQEALRAHRAAQAAEDKKVAKAAKASPLKEPYAYAANLSYSSAIETDYDYYACDGCYGCETGDDYCRGARYEGLRVERVDVDGVLSDVFRCNRDQIPQELHDFAVDLDLDKPHAYEAYGEGDYYGETLHVDMDSSKFAALSNWYSKHKKSFA